MRWQTAAVGSGLALLLTGCVVSIGGEGKSTRHEVPKPPPPIVVVPANTDDAATIAEIDAIGKLNFDAGKVTALKNIAVRRPLAAPVQIHLVNTTLSCLSFDAGKVEVLKVLIENPEFSPGAKEAILRQMERLAFDGSRSAVLEAIQKRAGS